ncbi:iron ABC transporter permease [Microbacterium halotolerans]|uniref:iron ABC transporter permease n=1 Tax=Microbacterium halotolerans TaxID=246613 RepID=UPI000E6A9DD5|nr:iron ABC transporter permease [Microbacterium halotolerans]
MTLDTTHAAPAPVRSARRGRGAVVIGAVVLWLAVASIVHLTQGTADVDAATLWAAATGGELPRAAAVLIESRVPRLAAALAVGSALGFSGAAMQSVSRNPLASPETTAVGAGAFFALTLAAALGIGLSPLAGLAAAFTGGLVAAAAVLGLASGRGLSPVRLVLAGSVLTLGISSLTTVLLLLLPWETQGLFAWGAGSLSQNGLDAVIRVAPVLAVAAVVVLAFGRRLDLLQLGEDAASSFGVPVLSTRVWVIVGAVALAAGAVTIAGPIGFVGLCAPAVMRLVVRRIPALRRQRTFLLLSAVAGVALVLTADVALRMMFGAIAGVTIPTGVVTSVIGSAFLIAVAHRLPTAGGDGESLITLKAGTRMGRRRPGIVIAVVGVLALVVAIGSVLVGDSLILLGDIANWIRGAAAVRVEIILDSRVPRVVGALLAGACLALAGLFVQAVSRNPLADPGILGVSASAGLGGVVVITVLPVSSDLLVFTGAAAGAAGAAVLLALFGRADQLRLVLVGIGVGAGAAALTTLLIVGTDPWNQTKAITWMGGSTYGASLVQIAPMAILFVVAAVVVARTRRDLDVLQFDDTAPRVWGVSVERSRVVHIGLAVALTAAATACIGVISFVGLVAPHAARMIVGKSHAALAPLTAILGAGLVVVSDAVGRTVLAPEQLPAGLVVALIGTPYFLWLLRRMREG